MDRLQLLSRRAARIRLGAGVAVEIVRPRPACAQGHWITRFRG